MLLYNNIYSVAYRLYMRAPKDAKHNDYNRVNNINMCSCFFFGYKNRSSIGTSSNSHTLALGTAAGIKKKTMAIRSLQ